MALKLADVAGFEQAARARRASAASCAASASPTRSSAPPPAASRAPRSASTTPAPRRCSPAAITQGQGHETDLQADRLRPARHRSRRGALHPGRHRPGVPRRGHRRLALGHASAARPCHMAAEKIVDQGEADRRPPAQGRCRRHQFRRRDLLSSPKTNRTLTIKEVATEAVDPAKLPKDMEVGPDRRPRPIRRRGRRTSPTAATSASSRSIPETGTVEILRYSVVDDVGTVLNPLLLKGQIVGGVAQGVGQILMEDIHFDGDGQLVTGSFMDYAMPRADRHQRGRGQEQSGADQDQSARRQGRGRGRLRRRDAGGRQRHGRRALAPRHPPHRDAGDAGAGVAHDPTGEWRVPSHTHRRSHAS